MEDLFVKPEARGRGIGKTMLAYLAKLAKALGKETAIAHFSMWLAAIVAFGVRLFDNLSRIRRRITLAPREGEGVIGQK